MTRSISRTLEYSYNDFTISQIAKGLGESADAEKYIDSSGNWKNLFKADQSSYINQTINTGFVGFFQPKFLNETWAFQDPLQCSNIPNNLDQTCSLQNNAAETFGNPPRIELSAEHLAALETRVVRVETDNRLQPWEWLVASDGRILKTDGSDHCRAHDLVGCQDIAWDIAGAIIEFDLSEGETEQMLAVVERASGRRVDRDLVRLLHPCYLAFQTGSYAMAAGALSGWPEEQGRLERRRAFYAGRLLASLSRSD